MAGKMSGVLAATGWGPAASPMNAMARTVVKRESKGEADAYNAIPCGNGAACPGGQPYSGNAVGWFQLCDRCHAGKGGSPKGKAEFRAWASNPLNNSALAHTIFLQAGWQPWSSSGGAPSPTSWDPDVSGDVVQAVFGDTDPTGVEGAVSSVAGAVGGIGDIVAAGVALIEAIFDPNTYLRLGEGILGFTLVSVGVVALVVVVATRASKTPTGGAVKKVATAVATKKL